MDLMTRRQFIDYAAQTLPELEESLMEAETQARSETALFGDAGPGQWLHVNALRQYLEGIRRQYLRLTNNQETLR